MSKLGDKAKDIFSKSEKKPLTHENVAAPGGFKKAGRPKIHPEGTTKTLVTIRKSQLFWLDRLSLEVREKSDFIVDRGLLVRALIDALIESKIDLSNIKSEEEVRELICNKLRK